MIVLVLGSGPNASEAIGLPRAAFDKIAVINNAWRVRPDWDALLCPDDFPARRRPEICFGGQEIIGSEIYVPANNHYGGVVYAGATMAFSASYWVLHALRPTVIAYLGCDMVYPSTGKTHFYGTGTADPLRADITLRSLEAKSARLQAIAAAQGCALVNLSTGPSRLTFPRARPDSVADALPVAGDAGLIAQARQAEEDAGYLVPSGKYWTRQDVFDPAVIDRIDALWLATLSG